MRVKSPEKEPFCRNTYRMAQKRTKEAMGMRTGRMRRKGRRMGWGLLAAGALLLFAMLTEQPAEALLHVQVRQQAQKNANRAVQTAAASLLASCDPSEALVIRRDDDGAILSMQTDPVRLGQMQTRMYELVQAELDRNKPQPLKIPVGTLTGWSFLRERGPSVTVRFAAVSAARCTLRNQFREAGVNQTLHEIWLDAELTVYPLLMGAEAEIITVSCCVAQTVIVGQVPSVTVR